MNLIRFEICEITEKINRKKLVKMNVKVKSGTWFVVAPIFDCQA